MKNFKSMKKAELVKELAEAEQILVANKETELADMVTYALKQYEASAKKVSKDELIELCEEVQPVIENVQNDIMDAVNKIFAEEPLPIETSPKKLPLKKKDEPKQEAKEEEKPVETKKEDKPQPKVNKKNNDKVIELATQFPKKLKLEDDNIELDMSIQSLEDIRKGIEAGEEYIFAVYWTPRLIKQFNYDADGIADTKITKFDNDLDLCSPVHIAESGKVAYVISLYSDVMYMIKPEDLEVIDGMRYTNGAEFNIYKVK